MQCGPYGGSYHRGESRIKRIKRQCGTSCSSYHLVPKGGEAVRDLYKRPLLRQEASFFIEIYNWMELSTRTSRFCRLLELLVPTESALLRARTRTNRFFLEPERQISFQSALIRAIKAKIENQEGNWLKNSQTKKATFLKKNCLDQKGNCLFCFFGLAFLWFCIFTIILKFDKKKQTYHLIS